MRRLRASFALTCLLAVSALVQWQRCRHAVVPALDSVRYVALAQSIELQGLSAVLAQTADHPLFPILIGRVHRLVAMLRPRSLDNWLLAAQLVAATGIVLCTIPLFVLLRDWLGRSRALVGCAIFCVLPEVTRVGAEALSDGWALLALLAGLACIGRILAQIRAQWCASESACAVNGLLWLFVAGISTGFGLIAGPSAVVVVLALVLFPLSRPATAVRLYQQLHWLAPFAAGFGLVVVSSLLAVGAYSPSQISARLFGAHRAELASIVNASQNAVCVDVQWFESDGEPLEFTRGDSQKTIRRRGWPSALMAFAGQLGQLTHYWIGAVAAWGAWKMRRARNCLPGRFLFCFALAYACVAVAHAAENGYLCARHLLPLSPVLVGWVTQGMWSASRRIMYPERWLTIPNNGVARYRLLAAVLILPVLPVALLPLHQHRWGHRAAAQWIAAHAQNDTPVFDTSGLTALYTGRPTFRAEAGNLALANSNLGYVVVAEWELQSSSRRAETLRTVLHTSGELAARFEAAAGSAENAVLVYRWRPDRFARHFLPRHSKQSFRKT
jgi:hypothetical protein